MEIPSRIPTAKNEPLQPAFHRRPMCVAAIGVLLGTLLVRAVAPPACYVAAAALLVVAAGGFLTGRKMLGVMGLFMGASLILAGLAYPASGVFPRTGSVLQMQDAGLGGALLGLREQILTRINLLFPQNAGVAAGMLLGDKAGIDGQTLTSFSDVGVMHLLAISGLHVSVLAGALSLLLRRGRWTRLVVVTLFLLVYGALTAFSPSVVRAAVMLFCSMLAFPLRRRPDVLSSMSLAFIIILLLNPLALFYTGFQLSFCAVYGLALLTHPLERPLQRLGALGSLMAASTAVTIATVPIMALGFGRVQLTSLVTNLFVLPLVPFFLIPAFAGVALSFVWLPLGNLVAAVARIALNMLVAFAAAGGAVDVALPRPNAVACLLYLASLLFLSPLCLWPRKKRYLCFAVGMGLCALIWRL